MTQQTAATLQILQAIPWFLELKPDQLDCLLAIASVRALSAGEVLFHEGDREDCLYVLLEGRIELNCLVPTRGVTHLLTAEPLDVIGWSSLTPVVRQRTASAIATEPSLLLALQGSELRELCEFDHDLGYVFLRRISNVTASRLLVNRLALLDLIVQSSGEHIKSPIES